MLSFPGGANEASYATGTTQNLRNVRTNRVDRPCLEVRHECILKGTPVGKIKDKCPRSRSIRWS